MKKLLIAFCIAAMLLSLAACASSPASTSSQPSGPSSSGSSTSQSDTVYKVAYMGPMTGNSSQYGERNKAVYDFAIEEINASGMLNGKLEITYYDDKNDAKEAVTVANKIVLDDEVLLCFGPFSSSCAMAAAPVFGKAQIALVSPSASHQDFTGANEYMVTGSLTQDAIQGYNCEFVYNTLGLQTMGMIALNDDVGVSSTDLIEEKYTAMGGTITSKQMYTAETIDFTPMLSNIKQTDPEVIYAYGTYTTVAQIAVQARQLDITVPMFSTDNIMVNEFLEIGGEAVEGHMCLTGADPNLPVEKYQAFLTKFTEATGLVVDSIALNAYDQAYMLANAIQQYGADREAIASYMRNVTDFEGIAQTYSVVDGIPQRPFFPVIVQNGEFVSYTA